MSMQVRAFGLFLKDVVARLDTVAAASAAGGSLATLVERCLIEQPSARPLFAEIDAEVSSRLYSMQA